MKQRQLIDRVGPNPVIQSWGYVDAWLRQPDARMPLPPLSDRYCRERELWIPQWMAPSRVQFAGNGIVGDNNVTVTMGSAGTNGNAFIVAIGSYFDVAPSSVTDSNSNSYAQDIHFATGRDFVYSCLNLAGSPTTVTVNNPGSGYYCVTVIEVSGLLTASAKDQTATNSPSGTTFTSTATSTTLQASEYLLGVQHTLSNTATWTVGSGWSLVERRDDGTYHRLHTQDQVVSATGTYASTGTTNEDTNSSSLIVTYKAIAATGLPFVGRRLSEAVKRASYW